MLTKELNLPEPRKPRKARWPEDAGRVKNLEVGDVLVVDGERYAVRRDGNSNCCSRCALDVANVKGLARCVALESLHNCNLLPCAMCNGGRLINNDYYFDRL